MDNIIDMVRIVVAAIVLFITTIINTVVSML